MSRSIAASRVMLKSVAIPAEHGGWMFLCEPILLGLGAGFTAPGLFLGLAALGAFLTRHPLKIAIDDRRKDRRYPRTILAERFALGYALFAGLAFAAMLATTRGSYWLPLIAASPLALLQLYYDGNKRSRDLAAELSGSLALGSVAAALALMAGWALPAALALWAILAARSITAILYVRARLRLEYGKPSNPLPVWVAHAVALIAVAALAVSGLAPWMAVAAMVMLGARAGLGLSRWHRPARPQTVGIYEMLFGFATVILVTAGYWLRL
jgi:hypothetical protein